MTDDATRVILNAEVAANMGLIEQIVALREGEGLSDSEISTELGISRQRVHQLAPQPDDGDRWTPTTVLKLRQRLSENGNPLPRDDFANLLGVRLLTVLRWEHGQSRPSWKSRRALDRVNKSPAKALKLLKGISV